MENEIAIDLEEEEGRREAEEEEEDDERLRRQGWYLGRGTADVATTILLGGVRSNTFAVFRDQNNELNYVLTARFRVEEVEEDIVEHLRLSRTDDGLYLLQGETTGHNDIIAAVNSYVSNRQPPLTPALGKSFETQLSIPDDPPSYTQADRVLAPDLTPLPNVTAVKIESAKEAKAGSLGRPGSVLREDSYRYPPPHIDNPHWYRYQDHCCLHPKNCLHFCCYRDTYWDGHREDYLQSWLSLKGVGPLRFLGLLLLYIFCGPCAFCCGILYYFCSRVC